MKHFPLFTCLLVGIQGLPHGQSSDKSNQTDSIFVRGLAASEPISYQLSLQLRGNHFCAATLLSVKDVLVGLTARHCVQPLRKIGIPPQALTVVAGAVGLNDHAEIEQTRFVTRIVEHEKADVNENVTTDIALLFFNEPFVVNEHISPISLPPKGLKIRGKLLLTGWNWITSLNDIERKKVRTMQADVMDKEVCQKLHNSKGNSILNNQFCSSWIGDTGSAAVSTDGKFLAGILSNHDIIDVDPVTARPKELPGVYSDVSSFVDWIDDQVAIHLESESNYHIPPK